MSAWENENKRKGIITSVVVHLALLIVFIFFGLSYLEPKPEEGIAINLGYMNTGMNINPDPVQSNPSPSTPQVETSPSPTESPVEDVVEDVATQDQVDAPKINTTEETIKEEKPKKKEDKPKETPTEKPVENKSKPEETKPVEEPPKPEPPKPDAQVNNALQDLFNNPGKQSAGDDQEEGVKGKPTGKANSPNFSNPDGMGSQGEGYYLNGRKNLNAPKNYPCQAQGKVVVLVWVNREGKTVRAEPGKRGSTTTDQCLLKVSRESAMNTEWSADHNGADLVQGHIVYVYSQN